MERIERYKNRIIVVEKSIDRRYRALLRNVGIRDDRDLGIEEESESEALTRAREFIDGIPEMVSL